MSHQAIKEYLLAIVNRYLASTKLEKSKLLNDAELICKLSRKQIIRRLNDDIENLKNKQASGRPRKYSRELLVPHIRHLWISMERISAKRMKAAMDEWLNYYPNEKCPSHIKFMLQKVSISTLARILRDIRGSETAKKGISTTCPARYMKNKIPINNLDHKVDRPGYTQSDTVAHCGTRIAGIYAHSITLTDIHSTWTENRAILGKKAVNVRGQFVDFRLTLPYTLYALNTDSGSEFINDEMLTFTHENGKVISFTRSRPYHKNDNCFVEQKNFTHVRELFGYERIEDPYLVELMNDIYKNYWNPFQNFFIPTFKLKEKYRIGAKTVKKYDTPQTPYNRLIQSGHLTEEQIQRLKDRKKELNPFALKEGLEMKLSHFFTLLKQSNIRRAAA